MLSVANIALKMLKFKHRVAGDNLVLWLSDINEKNDPLVLP
jgi:hypothetical protein